MRDLLKPSEYAILKATLPLVMVLECNSHGACFSHFWNLPRQVRDQISGYPVPTGYFRGQHTRATIDRFEIYQPQSGQGDMLLLAFSHINAAEYIECVGQYCRGVFVRQPLAVSRVMVAQAEAMSKACWSWKKLSASDKRYNLTGFCLLPFGVATWIGMAYFGFGGLGDIALSLQEGWRVIFLVGYFFAFVAGTILGVPYSVLPLLFSWSQYRQQRADIAKELQLYSGGVVLG